MVLAPGQRRAGGNQRVHLNRSSGVWVADEIDRQRHAVLGLMPEESIRSLLAPELPDPATVRGISRHEVYLVVSDPAAYRLRHRSRPATMNRPSVQDSRACDRYSARVAALRQPERHSANEDAADPCPYPRGGLISVQTADAERGEPVAADVGADDKSQDRSDEHPDGAVGDAPRASARSTASLRAA